MRKDVDCLFRQLEVKKEEILGTVSDFSDDDMMKKPGDNMWSLGELINHFMLVEKFALNQFQDYRDLKVRRRWMDRFRFLVVRCLLATGLKVKVPVADVNPKGKSREIGDIHKEWDSIRQNFKGIVDDLGDNELDYCYFYHPYAGYFTCKDGLIFLIEHMNHHDKQLNRLVNYIRE